MARRNIGAGRRQRGKPVHRDGPTRRGSSFRCVGCGLDVPMRAPGTAHRNHCPHCLCSRHVDRTVPGDRASSCRGRMDPISITVRDGGEWVIIHRCAGCGWIGSNRSAGDDSALALVRIAVRPIARSGLLFGHER
ncbi:RNHCP domain-containing protein [Rhodococcus sp. BE178]|uniref:RNHCP domain-containing protein n=1 Tax=Rhodococcus sp. BE178 TaxID=2817737 RepID=UPI003D1EC835